MKDLDYVRIGAKMKQLRNEHGITQEQVAKELGCTIGFVSNVENNRAKLNLKVLSYYAHMCGVTIDTFLNVSDDAADKEEAIYTDEMVRLFKEFNREEQEKIIKTLKLWKA